MHIHRLARFAYLACIYHGNKAWLLVLCIYMQVVRRNYGDGWTSDAEIKDARFKESSLSIRVELEPDWMEIGDGWRVRPESRPEVSSQRVH